MKKLRGPDGCPWDKEQTLETLKKTLLEETYEVLEVMEEKNHEELKGELGDLLLQIVFQSEIMEEKNYFSIDDVCREITEKLIRRHPHIFGDIEVKDSEEVLTNWEEIKKLEKAHKHRESVLDGIPKALPPLEKAYKIQSKIKKFEIEPSNIQESLNRKLTSDEINNLYYNTTIMSVSHNMHKKGRTWFNKNNNETVRFYAMSEKDLKDKNKYLFRVDINPKLFAKYNINEVPAVIFIKNYNPFLEIQGNGNEENSNSDEQVFISYGDSSLRYSLEQINKKAKSDGLNRIIKNFSKGFLNE